MDDGLVGVSIPGRDLGVLERGAFLEASSGFQFQSLEGIWGFWNHAC